MPIADRRQMEEEKQQRTEVRKSGSCLRSVVLNSFKKFDHLWIRVCKLGFLTPVHFAGLWLESNDTTNVKALLKP